MKNSSQIPLRVAYLGDGSTCSNSHYRAEALRRLGCNVEETDIYKFLSVMPKLRRWLEYRTGYRIFSKYILKQIIRSLGDSPKPYDLIWINGGELIGPSAIKWLKTTFKCPIILYQNDDPTGSRDHACFSTLRASLPFYDLCVLVRPETALEALCLGAKKSLQVFMSYDEIVHAAIEDSSCSVVQPSVSFVGTFIPGEERDSFLITLIEAALPVRLRGNNWHRSKLWPLLKACFCSFGVTGQAYAQVLRSASISLGLLSHQNRDLHTRRSFEITASGGLYCGERTSEHQLLYEEEVEAIFWDTAEECIEQCKALLADSHLNYIIRSAGSRRVQEMGVGNEDICRQILASIF